MDTPGPLTRRYVRVRGRVQGVGYRWFVRESAEAMSLTGWVRNREDGSVEAEVEGEPRALDEFIRRLKDGNPAASVDDIECREAVPQGGRGFEIRR